jgi:hypothetical protein
MQGIEATFDDISFDTIREPRPALVKLIPAAVALATVSLLGISLLHKRPIAVPDIVVRLPPEPTAAPVTEDPSKLYGGLIMDPSFVAELNAVSPAESQSPQANVEAALPAPTTALPDNAPQPENVPLPPKRDGFQIGDIAPLPPPRPPEFGSTARLAPDRHPSQSNVATVPTAPAAPTDNRNIFQKLFGVGQQSGASAPVATTAPESRGAPRAPWIAFPSFFSRSAPIGGYDSYTAVYDISAHTVYLPDGTKLEAHSGLGNALDDPRYVSQRMRGPTPPNVYELALRESSFHGVQALRLKPVGDSDLFGRDGLLAHPYMLGPNGDSNGCVSIKDYEAFLRAYENGQVKRLAVVANI